MNNSASLAAPAQLSIAYRPANDLTPDPRNARTHSNRQIEQLKASINEFNFANPIFIDPDGGIIAGHGRLMAAKASGLAQVPTITLAGPSDAKKRRSGWLTIRSRSTPVGTLKSCKGACRNRP